MAIDLQYLKRLCQKREKRCIILSYRRYQRLSEISKVNFNEYKDEYTPKVWAYALSLYSHQRLVEPFNRSHFEKAKSVKELWDSIWESQPYIHINIKDEYLEKQFEFMGYKKNLITHDLYAYVSSNRCINGNIWVHPKKYTTDIDIINKRPSIPYLYTSDYEDYILEGYTKIGKIN